MLPIFTDFDISYSKFSDQVGRGNEGKLVKLASQVTGASDITQ